MASRSWRQDDREFLKTVADRRDWIDEAVRRFPDRSEAAIRCMMQRVRIELGTTEGRFMENAWMADAVNGTRALLHAQLGAGAFPTKGFGE